MVVLDHENIFTQNKLNTKSLQHEHFQIYGSLVLRSSVQYTHVREEGLVKIVQNFGICGGNNLIGSLANYLAGTGLSYHKFLALLITSPIC